MASVEDVPQDGVGVQDSILDGGDVSPDLAESQKLRPSPNAVVVVSWQELALLRLEDQAGVFPDRVTHSPGSLELVIHGSGVGDSAGVLVGHGRKGLHLPILPLQFADEERVGLDLQNVPMVDRVHVFGGVGQDGHFHVLPAHDAIPKRAIGTTGDERDFCDVIHDLSLHAVREKRVGLLKGAQGWEKGLGGDDSTSGQEFGGHQAHRAVPR